MLCRMQLEPSMTAPILDGSLPLYCKISATTWSPTIMANLLPVLSNLTKADPSSGLLTCTDCFNRPIAHVIWDKTPAAAIAITIIPILNIALTFAPNGTNRLLIRTIKGPRSSTLSMWWRRFLLVRLLITVSCSATATTRL